MRRIWLLVGLTIVLAACGNDGNLPPPPEDTATAQPATSGAPSPTLIALQRDFESLQASHRAITQIWESLAAGEQVACGDYPAVLPPDSISAADDPTYEELAARLRRAAIDIEQAVVLWKAECATPRPNPDSATINQGRLAVRAAGDSLRSAAELLAGVQP